MGRLLGKPRFLAGQAKSRGPDTGARPPRCRVEAAPCIRKATRGRPYAPGTLLPSPTQLHLPPFLCHLHSVLSLPLGLVLSCLSLGMWKPTTARCPSPCPEVPLTMTKGRHLRGTKGTTAGTKLGVNTSKPPLHSPTGWAPCSGPWALSTYTPPAVQEAWVQLLPHAQPGCPGAPEQRQVWLGLISPQVTGLLGLQGRRGSWPWEET